MGSLPLHRLSPPEARPNGTFGRRLVLLVEDFRIFFPDQIPPFPINHLTGAIDAEDAKLVVDQEETVLDGVETDFELALGPLDGFEELRIFDGHAELIADGRQKLAPLRTDLEMVLRW